MLCAFPIEIANRELDGVIYLALHLAKRGFPTLFGERMVTQYVKNNNHPVLYFDIEQYVPMNKKVLEQGGIVFNLNAEGFAFLCDTKFIDILEHIQNDVTKICLFGEKQLELVKEHLPTVSDDILVATGHHSFDLASEKFAPYYRNEGIIAEHGEEYILINLNNGIFNHAMGLDNYLKMIQRMDEWKIYTQSEYLEFIYNQAKYQERLAEGQFALIELLAKTYPDRHIIIRPHPTENNEYYTDRLEEFSNVYVTNQGQVREWITSAACVIHHDCTTSLEALLMGKTVIQYRPVFNEEYVDELLATIGLRAENPEEVLRLVEHGQMDEDVKREQLANFEPNLANVSRSAAETVADMAASMSSHIKETWIPEPLGLWDSLKCWRKHISKVIRSKQPGRNGRKVSYALNKFPRLPLECVVERVEKLRAIDPTLPKVSVSQLALNTYLMEPEEN